MKYLKKTIIFLCFVLLVFSGWFLHIWITPEKPAKIVEKTVVEQVAEMDFSLYKLANKERKKKMVWNPCLANKAEERAKDIFETKLFSHEDRNGKIPYKTIINMCIEYAHAGENLSTDFQHPEEAHYALMNSPTHKANIIGDYTDMGVGCFENVCVEFFAK